MDKEAIGESNKLKDKLASSMLAIEKKHVRLPGELSQKFMVGPNSNSEV